MSLSISTYIAIISTDILKNPGFDLEEIGKISLESVTDDFRKEFRTIEKPSTTTIGNQDASTFLITQQDKYKNF
ncbi:MAG TPA: hypothetical protein VFP25_07130, partial [Nitrososphaeraceae archaeon]|nr:hypothetical protein [Nitrososphaeraceae archaeon]